LSGQLGNQIKAVRQDLLQLLTNIVAGIDFPEEVGDTPKQDIEAVVLKARSQLDRLAQTARSGKFLREGLRLAIVGRPNVGKSSLLNQLLSFERAIVTDIPGTTRDLLEEPLDINGIPVILVDTAGIHPTCDAVEMIGIERTKLAIADSQLVLLVTDISQQWGLEEDEILTLLADRPWILVKNKIDLVGKGQQITIKERAGPAKAKAELLISAKTGQGVELVCAAVEDFALGGNIVTEEGASLNDRQAELCEKALVGLALVTESLNRGMPQDCLASDLKSSIDFLSEICGEKVTDEVIAQVFAKFCIGK